MRVKNYSTIFPLIFYFSLAQATPAWVKSNPEKLNGSIYTVSCYGEGPALDIARNQAKDSCLSSALRQAKTVFKVKTLTVETETAVGLHQEVESELQISGLTCKPINEDIQESDSQVKIWIQCRFDLSLAKIEGNSAKKETQSLDFGDSVKNRKELSKLKSKANPRSHNISSAERKVLTISSVPQCTSLLIEGKSPRVQACTENPLSVVLNEGDLRIIVRAAGYQPKTVVLSDSIKPNDTVQIVLEENQK